MEFYSRLGFIEFKGTLGMRSTECHLFLLLNEFALIAHLYIFHIDKSSWKNKTARLTKPLDWINVLRDWVLALV